MTTVTPNAAGSAPDFSLSTDEFWTAPLDVRAERFEWLRANDPYRYFDLPEVDLPMGDPDQKGYHALVRHADIVEASRQPDRFCSGKGATSIFDQPAEFNEFFGSMINLDDPRHARLRGLVSKAFTPRRVQQLEDSVHRIAGEVVDEVIDRGECDFVTDIAAQLPLRIICEMMGVEPEQYGYVFDQSNIILGAGDSEYVPDPTKIVDSILGAGFGLAELMKQSVADREATPRDDLLSSLIQGEVDGERLSPEELASFFILLLAAGNETTRNAISWGLHLLTDNPDQYELWKGDPATHSRNAVEEIVRWASPVIYMRRTVTADGTRLGDATFDEGDKLMLCYWAGDHDPRVYDEPERFDITRSAEAHVGFGAPGPHFCLGAHLARREVTVMFDELFRRMPNLHATGQPDRLQSSFINGVKHLPCAW
ncbi:MAG: cytochrome P450 [Acidimicrobiales bacterium]